MTQTQQLQNDLYEMSITKIMEERNINREEAIALLEWLNSKEYYGNKNP